MPPPRRRLVASTPTFRPVPGSSASDILNQQSVSSSSPLIRPLHKTAITAPFQTPRLLASYLTYHMGEPFPSMLTTTVFSQCRSGWFGASSCRQSPGVRFPHHFNSFSCSSVNSCKTEPHCCGIHNYGDMAGLLKSLLKYLKFLTLKRDFIGILETHSESKHARLIKKEPAMYSLSENPCFLQIYSYEIILFLKLSVILSPSWFKSTI